MTKVILSRPTRVQRATLRSRLGRLQDNLIAIRDVVLMQFLHFGSGYHVNAKILRFRTMILTVS